jgi:hypothetical protein
MKKYILVTLICLYFGKAFSQMPDSLIASCNMCSPLELKNSSLTTYCNPLSLYTRLFDSAFEPSSNFPNYVITVNLIFMQRDDGSGNFQQNDPEQQSVIDAMITEMNNTFAFLSDPHSSNCYTGSDFIPDSKVRFEVNKIYKRDSYGWDNSHDDKTRYMCPASSDWYLNYIDNQVIIDPLISRGINIYFTEGYDNYFNLVVNQTTTNYNGYTVYCSQFPSFTDFQRTSKIHIPDLYSKFWWMKNIAPSIYNQPWDPAIKGWFIGTGRSIAHEIGHSLWLSHDCPYYSSGGCASSIMNPSSSSIRNYLPPTEIGRMFASLSLSNVRQFISKDAYNSIPLVVNSLATWGYEIRSYRDIIINSGGNLTVSCNLIMPPQGDVVVNSGGALTISGATINLDNNSSFSVELGGTLTFNSGTIQ